MGPKSRSHSQNIHRTSTATTQSVMDRSYKKRHMTLKETTVYGSSYTDVDPVKEQTRRDFREDRTMLQESRAANKSGARSRGDSSMMLKPTLSTRMVLGSSTVPSSPRKYMVPKSRRMERAERERHKIFEESLKFCKTEVRRVPSPQKLTRLNVSLKAPSAEITEAKVMPSKPSATLSDLYPDPPRKKDLNLKKPKSGIVINEEESRHIVKPKKRIVVKRKRPRKPKPEPPQVPEDDTNLAYGEDYGEYEDFNLEEMMRKELETIQEMGEGEDAQDSYLTKQFRRKVSKMSRATSLQSKDYRPPRDEGEESSEEDLLPPSPDEMTEEERVKEAFSQKFRRDSEERRYEAKPRKVKKGTLESHSFTRLKQPTLKTFYYGVKQGTFHQGDEHFGNFSRYRQGLCTSVAAYCYAILKHPDRWTSGDIDEVLESGNALYVDSAERAHIHQADVRDLEVGDLLKYCQLGDRKVRFKVSEPIVSGMTRSEDKHIYNLTKGLSIFFSRNDAALLYTDLMTVAIWKDRHFYFFDANPRTIDLFSNAEEGLALMANFYDAQSVLTVLLNRTDLGNIPFIIYGIKATKVLPKNVQEVDSEQMIAETDNYKILSENKAVALGSFDLADLCFGFSRNKQSLTIATVALVYSKLTPASAWHKGTVDKIMIIGNQLFLECIRNDDIEEVTVDDLPGVFTIGPYVVDITIYPKRFVELLYKKNKCTLDRWLDKFFQKHTNCILQIDSKTHVAVWKQRDMFHLFDPYSRNSDGLRCRDGEACCSMYSTLGAMTQTLSDNFDSRESIFQLHALKVCKIHRDPQTGQLFPRGVPLNDHPIESFKQVKMRRKGNTKMAVTKPVTVDNLTRAAKHGGDPDQSILEVGSNIHSLGPEEVPPMVHKFPSRAVLRPEVLNKEFIADLDSPSLSDTQIEPGEDEEEDEGDYEFVFPDLDAYDLTQEELELSARGEDEGEGEEGLAKSPKASMDAEEEALSKEMEEMEQQGEEWYMAATQYTQVGSQSLVYTPSRISAEMNTEIPPPIVLEYLPPAQRDISGLARKKINEIAARYDFGDATTREADVTLSVELLKDTNFVTLPDGSQIVLGGKNLADFGNDIELMAPFVGVMAAAISKKYAIYSWSRDIVDYALKCGSELYASSNLRYDQVYKLEIPKITLGHTDLSVQVDYVFDSYVKPRVLETAIDKILFAKAQVGVMVTPTYTCAVFLKNHLYYLYDGFANNEVGLGRGPSNRGVACLARFQDCKSMVARIIHNKRKRESGENLEFNRFVLSSCVVKTLQKRPVPVEQDDDDAKEEREIAMATGEGEDEPAKETPSKVEDTTTVVTKEKKFGYQLVEQLYKIEGTKAVAGGDVPSDFLKEDFFAALYASLLLLTTPLKRWDGKRVDQVLDQAKDIYLKANDLDECSKKFIRHILIDDHFFSVSVKQIKFPTYESNKTLRVGIDTMLAKKHERFLLQFPSRSYAICVSVKDSTTTFHVFDPCGSPQACWLRFKTPKTMIDYVYRSIDKSESYNFHTFEVMSISKAPREVLLSNRLKRFKVVKNRPAEPAGRPFNEELHWLDVEPIPWSRRVDKRDARKWHHWLVEFQDDLFSLFGNVNSYDEAFSDKSRGKQGLATLVIAIGMLQIYDLEQWTPSILDSILENGDNYFRASVDPIEEQNYELAMDDLKSQFVIFPYGFHVKFAPVINGTMFLVRLKQFNLYKALRYFFDGYEARFGIIFNQKGDSNKRQLAFGKCRDGEYFMYDCESYGPPMFMNTRTSFPYALRTITLNRLLHVITLTLRGGDFYVFEVELTPGDMAKED